MFAVYDCIANAHDLRLVGLAAVICALASFTAITLLHHVGKSAGRMRHLWFAVSAVATGFGIWATHFIAMLAFSPGVPSGYNIALTILSLIGAIILTGAGLAMALSASLPGAALLGGAMVGGGIAAMHYTGMAAFQIEGRIVWDPVLVVASIALGVVLGAIALQVGLRGSTMRSRIYGALLLTAAICSHHFTAMGAVSIISDPTIAVSESALPTRWLAAAVALASFAIVVIAFAGLALDIGDRRRSDAAARLLADSERREREKSIALEITLAHISQGLSMFDADGRLTVWNDRYIEVYGMSSEVVKYGASLAAITGHRKESGNFEPAVAEFVAMLREELAQGRTISSTTRLKDGRMIAVTNTPTAGGGWVATHEDVTDRHRHETKISFMAHHDLLTGLPNRAFFAERIDDAVARLCRSGEPFAVFMLDLDKFKNVNDTLGHPAGDQLLRETAQRLKSSLRDTDVLARLGGDEFAIIQLGQTNQRDGAAGLAARIVNLISEPYCIEGNVVSVGTSIGIALAPDDASETTGLLKMADLALYAAKSAGRNGFRFFDAAMLADTGNRRRLEADLREAITRGDFELQYQPLVDAKTRRTAGFEALVRWRSPTRGFVMPDQFIPLAEETGLIVPLGAWILQQACMDAVRWPSHMKVAVNLSAVQLAQPNLLQIVLCALVESSLAPERLELEITETALFKSDVDYSTLIRQLKNLGVSIALDDFGTGYSSLSYLTMFPFDKIKIDRSFTLNMTRRADCAAIISAVLALGRALDTETVAEGVETEQQFGILRAAGVTFVQGYLFGRPRPASDLVLDEAGAMASVESAA
jgi:diguanylate cyclase (GGDEF)-like protein